MAETETLKAIDDLLKIMATLRAPDGCQWDKKQTPESLKPYILEETYELLEAIDQGNPQEICDELGDLLLQVVFQAQIFSESGQFTIKDVAESISSKMKRRHPHIFSSASHEGHQQRWEEIKRQERSARGQSHKVADSIPNSLPALKRAQKALNKSSFTDSYLDIDKVIAELNGLKKMHRSSKSNGTNLNNSFGQILLSITCLAQSMGIDAEDSLRSNTNKMIEEIDNSKELH